MKKTAENRYPNSATLFKFCKEALEIRYEGNVKVIDQDVGAILGYDPADCSHWKKGKKNIRALSTLKSIADHLDIDERLLIDIASGRIGFDEAVFEFRGYGEFSLTGKNLESLRKEFFRNPDRWQQDHGLNTFDELFQVKRTSIIKMANDILSAANITEAPIYIPEILQLHPNLTMVKDPELTEAIVVDYQDEGGDLKATIRYRGSEMRPYVRFTVARELYKFLVKSGHVLATEFASSPDIVIDIQANVFAGLLLVPADLLKKEVESVDSSLDIVLQLADTFWVSKAMMNQRLRDYLENLS